MINKILIANRGEIAVRVIKTAKKLGIKTVAVYSESDTNSLHTQLADESVFIGPSPSNESYLIIENILNAIKQTGADAVHPGYGFLSENPIFCKEVQKRNIIFLGPNSEAMQSMGDKITSKQIAKDAGVTTIPGYIGVIENVDKAEEIAENIGYPVMLKASAGGGGRGMRIVSQKEQINDAFYSAKNEAKKNFGDDRIFIEKFIEKPRHIEIQILADYHGNYLCLGERECSIQRYNQKVIEESPSPFIHAETREKMYQQSIILAKKVNYTSVGTVEYIVDENKNFYFLEMNTRLQVEHPVTEFVTGLDLVEEMINIANGKKLKYTQKDIDLQGWAIEARICAEDPTRGFLPSSGRVIVYKEPDYHRKIRVDTGIYEGGEVSMFYDSMIAKLITYGKNRAHAIKRMQNALDQFIIEGVTHNIEFLQDIINNSNFKKGKISTKFIESEYPDGFQGARITSDSIRNIIATSIFIKLFTEKRLSNITGRLIENNYKDIGNRWDVMIEDEHYPVTVMPLADNSGYIINQNEEEIIITSDWTPASYIFKGKVNNQLVSVKVKNITNGYNLISLGSAADVRVVTPRTAELYKYMPIKNSDEIQKDKLYAPISGKIIDIKVKEGEKVLLGQDLLTLEAMKMENILPSPYETVIKKIHIENNSTVQLDDLLIEFGGEGDAAS